MKEKASARDILLLLLLTVASVLLHGYHLGHQDGAIYLPAIKKNLNPALYPYDAVFFLTQARWTLFDEAVAYSVRATHLPLDLIVFLWHLGSIFLVLLASLKLSRRCFEARTAQWAAVTMIWAARLLPVAGTGLHLMDRYLHPRDLAMAFVLFAFVAVLDGRIHAVPYLLSAAAVHPTMAVLGLFHLTIQRFDGWKKRQRATMLVLTGIPGTILLFSSASLLGPVQNEAWHEVLATRPYLFPLRWHWYEWLGAIAPLLALAWFARIVSQRTTARVKPVVRAICNRVVWAGVLGIAGSILITTVPVFERLIPAEPMRTLHFVYFLFVFLGGGLAGEYVLRNHAGRWLLLLVPLCLAFFFADRLVYGSSPHVEWPGRVPRNNWVQAFDWIRRNTPRDAMCALDPRYMLRPGEDSHGFRAFAERSMLADWVKDRAVAALNPDLAYTWREQVRDREHWQDFCTANFRRLRQKYQVSWVVLEGGSPAPASAGLPCPYVNGAVMVCRIQ